MSNKDQITHAKPSQPEKGSKEEIDNISSLEIISSIILNTEDKQLRIIEKMFSDERIIKTKPCHTKNQLTFDPLAL